MARKKVLFINILFLIFLFIPNVQCSKLNVPRVLLPIFNDISTNFTLEVTEGGCYKWTTSRVDLIQLIPLEFNFDKDCSSKVVVSTLSKERSRNTAIVLAEDFYTGQVLRCDVILDVISSLNIVTTTRELFMEEAPEAFEVRAYDDQGNEFTTLEGVEFEWTLGLPEHTVLRFITFRDSPYETPVTVQAFEEMGKQGHIVLLEGVKTGSAKVSVQLPHPEYRKLDAIEVSLMVIANLIIEPSDIYILRGDVVHYKIIQVKHGRLEEIKLPSPQYYLVSENPDIGLIERNSGYLTGLNIGKTRVFLHDSNVKEDSGLKLPSANVNVQYPARISLTLMPFRNWAVLLGEQHDIVVEVFASDDHKIHLGEGVNLKTIVDEKYFSLSFRSTNGSFLSGTAVDQGTTEIETTLVSVISNTLGTVNLEPRLTAKAEMLIFPPIILNPGEVVLPWDPLVKPRYDVELKAVGGDGKFLWSTSNHSVGVVTQTGYVRTQFHGNFDACASMTRNHHNRRCTSFYILPPSRMEIIEFVMEAEIGTSIFLNVALYADRPTPGGSVVQIPFSKCKELPFNVKSSDSNFFFNESAFGETIGISCASLAVVSLIPGTSRITVQYQQDNVNLEESVFVAAYRPLELLHPISKQSVLAIGTSRYLVFTGGPRPWPGRPSEHVVSITSSQATVVESLDKTQNFKVPGGSDTYVILVTCKEIGESTITLNIFNKPLVPKCKYKESVASATVICAHPSFIYLQPEIKMPDSGACPMDLSSERVIVQSYTDIDLLVTVKDSLGRSFDNVTSLEFQWDLNPDNLGTIMNKDGIFEKIYYEENILLPNKSYQVITPESQIGIIEVEACILGYRASNLKMCKVKTNPKIKSICNTITLYLVDDTIVIPNKTSIYNHPLNKQKLLVKQGSGYNEITLSSQDIASVKYNEALRQIEVTPKQPGELQINVRDLCLKSPPVVVHLQIVHVSAIRAEVPDRVEIGKCILAVVKFYDEFDNLMPLPKLEYLDIRYTMGDKILSLKLADHSIAEPWPVGEIHYIVAGSELGETKLVFAAGRGDREVISPPVNIQVFAPLKIFPKNATLLIGSVLQLTSHGGPQPDTNIEYTIESKNIADISVNGVIHALNLGSSRVIARSVSINPVTGKKVTNSQDSAEIYVIPLLGIKLSSPLTRFVEGSTVPIWVTGLPEKLSSLLLGSMGPPLQFFWGTHCSDILLLHGIFSPMGVKDNLNNKISVRARGIRPGHCTVELNVTVPGKTAGQPMKSEVFYTALLDVEVIEGFYLTAPNSVSGKAVLIAPFSTLQLNTNKDGYNFVKYSIHGEEYSEGNNRSVSIKRSIISIDNKGVVVSNSALGTAMVLISATDEHGLKQTLNVIIEVKLIHYMLLSAESTWMLPLEASVNVLPLGAQFKLKASYHDNTGAVFSAAECDLIYRTSRADLIDIKRNTSNSFSASSLMQGGTVVKVWADNCFKAADYIPIISEQTAKPEISSVVSGDVLCFWSSILNEKGTHGVWTADPEHVIHINTLSGIGVVTSNLPTKVFVMYDLTPTAKISLDVEPFTMISFVHNDSKILSNAMDNLYKVHVVLRNENNFDKTSNLYAGWQCNDIINKEITRYPFFCSIEFTSDMVSQKYSEIFNVKPSFNIETGLYACDFVPITEITEITSKIESNVKLTVVGENGVESPPLVINFLPGVYILPKELVIADSFSAIVTVSGVPEVLKQINVIPSDGALLEVAEPDYVSDNTISFEVTMLDYHWKLEEMEDPINIRIISKLTDQDVKIKIKMSSDRYTQPHCAARQLGSPLGNFMYDNKQPIVIFISLLIIFFITFYAYSQYVHPVIHVNVGTHAGTETNENNDCKNSQTSMHAHPEEGSTLLSPVSPNAGSSNKSAPCTPSSCIYRLKNANSPPLRYGPNETMNRSMGYAPDVRRNRSFL